MSPGINPFSRLASSSEACFNTAWRPLTVAAAFLRMASRFVAFSTLSTGAAIFTVPLFDEEVDNQ